MPGGHFMRNHLKFPKSLYSQFGAVTQQNRQKGRSVPQSRHTRHKAPPTRNRGGLFEPLSRLCEHPRNLEITPPKS